MESSGRSRELADQGGADFRTTHWSLVLAAGGKGGRDARAALEELCRAYWYPLYLFVRRQGHSPEDAKDFTQEFFSRLIETGSLASVEKGKGRFRSFLLTSMKNLLANEWHRKNRQKRGGGAVHFSLDELDAEERYRLEPADERTPEAMFEYRWARTLLDRVLAQLEAEYRDHPAGFEQLKTFLLEERGAVPYAGLSAKSGKSESALKTDVHRLRQRYRELFRREIAQTVENPAELEDELHHLFAVLSR